MELTKRLQAVADLVDENMIVADIGSDHAYLPCYLVLQGKVNKAYACEVADGPLQQSRKTIGENGLEHSIQTVKSDGLANVPGDIEVVCIAGMGVFTVLEILNASINKLCTYKKIVIQVNSHMELLREFISRNRYVICDETLVKENNKYYEIISFIPQEIGNELSEKEIAFGPFHLAKRTDLSIEYWKKQLATKEAILLGLTTTSSRYAEIERDIMAIKSII